MKKPILHLLAFSALLVWLTAASVAQTATATIKGIVNDGAGNAVPGAVVGLPPQGVRAAGGEPAHV